MAAYRISDSDFQTSFLFDEAAALKAASEKMAGAGAEERGAIFTRTEVVEFILHLTGYTENQPLHERQLLEPSMGQGDFLIPAVRPLMAAFNREIGDRKAAVEILSECICAVELHSASYKHTNALLAAELRSWKSAIVCSIASLFTRFCLTPASMMSISSIAATYSGVLMKISKLFFKTPSFWKANC